MNQRAEVGGNALTGVPRLPDLAGSLDGHIHDYRSSNNIFARHESPEAAVVRIVAIIAHHEIVTGGDYEFTVHDIFGHLRAPTGNVGKSQFGASLREILPRQAGCSGSMNRIWFIDAHIIDVNLSLDNLDVVAGDS